MATRHKRRSQKVYHLQPCRPPSVVSTGAPSSESPMLPRNRVCACTGPQTNSRTDLNKLIEIRRRHHVYAKIKSDRGVLKKANSFKDELKRRIIRRTPSTSRKDEPPLSPSKPHKHVTSPIKSPRLQKNCSSDAEGTAVSSGSRKSPKLLKRRSLQRGSSFSEGTSRPTRAEKKEQQLGDDIEKIELESKKIFQALAYIKDVVDKNILQMLPGSASIVLETILEIHQLLNNYFIDQESTTILSSQSQVHQNLAHLVRWADHILMNGEKALDRESAHEIISALEAAVQELLRLSIEKLRKNALTLPVKSRASITSESNGTKRTSLPDIPLTPREQKILKETSYLSPSDTHQQFYASKSAEDLLDSGSSDYPTGEPPPKPPLPRGYQSPFNRKCGAIRRVSDSTTGSNTEAPPPLPVKKRSASHSQDEMQHLNVASGGRCPSPRATSPLSTSPFDTITPLSQSPTSSISSALSAASSEDLLSDSRTEKAHSQSSSQATTPTHCSSNSNIAGQQARLSTYDNFDLLLPTGQKTQQFSEFAKKINELTSNIDTKGSLLEQFTAQFGGGIVPPLPNKENIAKRTLLTTNKLERGQVHSHYDNVFEQRMEGSSVTKHTVMKTSYSAHGFASSASSSSSCNAGTFSGIVQTSAPVLSSTSSAMYSKTMQVTTSQETFSSTETCSSSGVGTSSMESLQRPPPLPPKKRAVHAYMQMLGSYNGPSITEFARHSIHSVNFYQTQWYQHQADIFQHLYPRSNTTGALSDLSGGQRNSDTLSITSSSDASEDATYATIPPSLPPKVGQARCRRSEPPNTHQIKITYTSPVPTPDTPTTPTNNGTRASDSVDDGSSVRTSTSSSIRQTSPPPDVQKDGDSDFAELTLLDDVDVSDQLIQKKGDDGGCDIRGGVVDALIVHAASTGRRDFLYQEAFLTTYRTFISAKDLIDKLLYRYGHFSRMSDVKKKRLSRNAFALLIRVVDELCVEVDEEILQTLMELEFQLLSEGELMLGRVLRRKVIEQCEHRQNLINASQSTTLLSSYQLTAKQYSLTEFKSELLAEQMTLLDAELFQKIMIPEVLLWSKEQNEEHSPNLTKFTEHFNKMSFWCRTRILEHEDAKEREKYLMKFIKVMKYLRKLNNFNSYLAILSALDSAPVRRLEWQKQNMEALKEFCQLIDSSSSFRAYRQALTETEPPGIPYIGLILQDLTFIHIGNQDLLQDDTVNFAKRWQQFNVLDSMRRFKKTKYSLKRHPKVLAYFNNFDDYLSEESLWQISESIKPRGGKKKQDSK